MKTGNLGHSSFEVLKRARELERAGREVIHLHIGEPDFKTPDNIVEAAYSAMREGFTHYTDPQGIPELREAISWYQEKYRGVSVDPGRVIVTPGAKMMILYSLLVTVEPGDEVIYTDPGYMAYRAHIDLSGGVPVPWNLSADDGFSHDPEKLKSIITSKTKALILNFPHNPTGVTIDGETLKEIMRIAVENGIYVISDEIYSRIIFDGQHISALKMEGSEDYLFLIDGFSKTYAMTGWRIGYGIVPEKFVQKVVKLQMNTVSCATSFVQKAAIEAIRGPQDSVNYMVDAFKKRRDITVHLLENAGIDYVLPQGAFYVFPDLKIDTDRFTNFLLENYGVAVLPGSYFGNQGKGHIRISFANSEDRIRKGVSKILEALEKFS